MSANRMSDPETAEQFRRDASRVFGSVVAALLVAAIGLAVPGWLIGRWRGLAVGLAVGLALGGGSSSPPGSPSRSCCTP